MIRNVLELTITFDGVSDREMSMVKSFLEVIEAPRTYMPVYHTDDFIMSPIGKLLLKIDGYYCNKEIKTYRKEVISISREDEFVLVSGVRVNLSK